MSDEAHEGDAPRQRVERAGGRARRARLTPAPGSDPSPETAAGSTEAADETTPVTANGQPDPDDDRITRERPPHW
jgi:hypothetical protein